MIEVEHGFMSESFPFRDAGVLPDHAGILAEEQLNAN
jgi:hypothetical protein